MAANTTAEPMPEHAYAAVARRIRRRQSRERGHDGNDGEPACRRETFAHAIDDDATAQIGEQPRERVDGDEDARRVVAAAERPREERQDRERDAGPEHEHEREQDDDADTCGSPRIPRTPPAARASTGAR